MHELSNLDYPTLLGTWEPVSDDGRERITILNKDGHWLGTMTWIGKTTGKTRVVHESGVWVFQGGILTLTETNNDMDAHVPETSVGRITHIDDNNFIWQRDNGLKMIYHRSKP